VTKAQRKGGVSRRFFPETDHDGCLRALIDLIDDGWMDICATWVAVPEEVSLRSTVDFLLV
jgi:hypothetical protein